MLTVCIVYTLTKHEPMFVFDLHNKLQTTKYKIYRPLHTSLTYQNIYFPIFFSTLVEISEKGPFRINRLTKSAKIGNRTHRCHFELFCMLVVGRLRQKCIIIFLVWKYLLARRNKERRYWTRYVYFSKKIFFGEQCMYLCRAFVSYCVDID